MKPLDMLHKGDFNDMNMEGLFDGSVLIYLHKRRGNKYVTLRVRNLYQPDEEELDVTTGQPIIKRDIQ